jgi:sucrose phosphorylase
MDHKYQNVPQFDSASFAGQLARSLQIIYGSAFNEEIVNRILFMTNNRLPSQPEWNEKDVLLITYGNSIISKNEIPLRTLKAFLLERFKGVVSGVHILPFFPYSSDDGFAVTDYLQVNPVLGDWDDIAAISREFNLMVDLVVNHVSSKHPWFLNFLADRNPWKSYFISANPVTDYRMVVRPRSSPLFSEFETVEGVKPVWTTFSADQADLNYANPEVLIEMIRVLLFYIHHDARFIRLDAIAYLWKCKGTPCIHLKETHEVVKLLRNIASYVCPGTLIITETNVPNKENWSYFGNGDEAHMVYQFSLPPLVLQAIFSGNSKFLTGWARTMPLTRNDQTFLNYTASHDGIGIRPLEGIISDAAMDELIRGMIDFGALISTKTNTDGSTGTYEINITYFDAMKGTKRGIDLLQEPRFLCSQTIMTALKGIPAFYIHSFLATPNDVQEVEKTGRARSINRKQLNLEELNNMFSHDDKLRRIFNELLRMLQIRRNHPAFHPSSMQEVMEIDDRLFSFLRYYEFSGEKIYCLSNITNKAVDIFPGAQYNIGGIDLLSGERFACEARINFIPYQTRWILEI